MEQKLNNLFKKARFEPSEELSNKIWHKIVIRDRNIACFRLISLSSIGIASIFGSIPMFRILINDLAQSGFYEYFSMAFSNNGIFSIYWKEFAYSLAESLPTMSVVFLLTLVFIFFLSLHNVIKQIIKGQLSLTLQVNPV